MSEEKKEEAKAEGVPEAEAERKDNPAAGKDSLRKSIGKNAGKILDTVLNNETLEKMKANWTARGIILALACCNVLLLILVFALALYPKKKIGYVVEVNSLTGEQRTVRNAVQEIEKYTTPDYLMLNTVKSYITALRSVSNDASVNRENVKRVFAFTTGKASSYVKQFYNENPPLERGRRERVEVVIYNAMPVNAAKSLKFQVDWNEIRRNLSTGEIESEANYRADIDARQYRATRSTSDYNPLGLYIESVYISEIKDGFVRGGGR